jgi:carboxymethylenebutenolidase
MTEPQSQPVVSSATSYYLATPQSGRGRPVLVLHAWWGLNPFVQQVCDRLAGEGFVALAPDLFSGTIATTIEGAEQHLSRLNADPASDDRIGQKIKKAVALLQTLGGPNTDEIGVVAFSFGGAWTLWLATQKENPVAAAVVFYATGGGDSHAAFQFHMAESDPYEPAAGVEQVREQLEAAGKPAEFHIYPGTSHWFFENDRRDAYNPQAADLAWRRTVEFLKAHVPTS